MRGGNLQRNAKAEVWMTGSSSRGRYPRGAARPLPKVVQIQLKTFIDGLRHEVEEPVATIEARGDRVEAHCYFSVANHGSAEIGCPESLLDSLSLPLACCGKTLSWWE